MSGSEGASYSGFDSIWHYRPNPDSFDEMVADDGAIRPHWHALTDSLNVMGPAGLAGRWRAGRRLIYENGITYNVYGEPKGSDRPWPLDPIPLIINEREWVLIETAIRQRAMLLNAILADLYGPQRLLRDGLYPPELVFRHPGFLRPCWNVSVPQGTFLHNYSADLVRARDGRWWVIADRTQAPLGAGYALENRLVLRDVLPDMFRATQVRRLADFFQSYRETLHSLVRPHSDNPRIVLLTPGPFNEAYFEHAFLARYLGYTLVEGGDLTVRNNYVYLKTLGGLLPVELIVRRQDDSFCDPLELREDSVLGVPGLMHAVRAGNVAVVNALGSGLLESLALQVFLPALSRRLTGSELKIPTVATWWCGDQEQLDYVSRNLSSLIVMPTFFASRRHPIMGAKLTEKARQRLALKIRRAPADYVAQEPLSLSTVPVWEAGQLTSRHMVMRVYAVASDGSYTVMPGALARVTTSLSNLVPSIQDADGSKDTWVLSSAPITHTTLLRSPSSPIEINRATFDLPSRVADNLFWLGRYVERIDSTARISRALILRLQEPEGASDRGLEAAVGILCALGHLPANLVDTVADATASDREEALEGEVIAMLLDSERKNGICWTVHQLGRLAWMLRDRFSPDAWRILNRFNQQFIAPAQDDPLRMASARSLLDDTIMTLSSFCGLAAESMTRGNGWRFLEIGRRLERALQMVALLRYGLAPSTDDASARLQALLEIADGCLTYRSRYQTSMQVHLVVDLLLLDRANPRSVVFQLERLSEQVQELPEQESAPRSEEARIVLRLLTEVQLADATTLTASDQSGGWAGFDNFLAHLESELRKLSETTGRRYFDHTIVSRHLGSF